MGYPRRGLNKTLDKSNCGNVEIETLQASTIEEVEKKQKKKYYDLYRKYKSIGCRCYRVNSKYIQQPMCRL